MNRERVPAAVRREAVDRADGRCEYGGIPEAFAFVPHQLDHIIAVKHGGASTDR